MIVSAEIVAVGADVREYLKQPVREDGSPVRRGDREYVMSRGGLFRFAECPAKWLATEDEAADEAASKSTVWGTLIDCLLTDEARIEDRIAVYPEMYPCEPSARDPRTEKPWNNNSNFCRDWKEREQAGGKLCVTVEVFKLYPPD